jgi:hypothetical protein
MSRAAAHPSRPLCGLIGTLSDHTQAPGDAQAHYPEYTSCQQEPPHHVPSVLTAEVVIIICASVLHFGQGPVHLSSQP